MNANDPSPYVLITLVMALLGMLALYTERQAKARLKRLEDETRIRESAWKDQVGKMAIEITTKNTEIAIGQRTQAELRAQADTWAKRCLKQMDEHTAFVKVVRERAVPIVDMDATDPPSIGEADHLVTQERRAVAVKDRSVPPMPRPVARDVDDVDDVDDDDDDDDDL